MKIHPVAWLCLVIVVVVVICVTVLSAAGHPVPTFLVEVGIAALAGGLGVTVPSSPVP